MDHSLDDSLNLESDMGVDFEQPEDVVVSQSDLVLDHGVHDENIPMEFEHCEDQSMLMDTGNEEIIVSDFMGDQFSLQEYSVQSDQTTGLTTTVESNQQHMLSSQGDTLIDLGFQPQLLTTIKQEPHQMHQKLIPVKITKRNETTTSNTAPKQVAIAPKLPKLVPKTYTASKQMPIAPRPVSLIANRSVTNSLVKKVSVANVQGNSQGKTVLAQIGKQVIMVPSGAQKIKLVSTSGQLSNIQYIKPDQDQAQLIPNNQVSGANTKPVMTKYITVQDMQAQGGSQASATLTKLVGAAPRFLALQKAPAGNKVLIAAPSQSGVKFTPKQEIISLKSKLMPAPALSALSGNAAKHKVVITPNTVQNVILKPSTATKTTQVSKDSNVAEASRTQLHQINVPGKGVQYFRLVSNPGKSGPKPLLALPSKTFMLSDGKGNLIQMSAEKVAGRQPPSLVVSGVHNVPSPNVSKPQQKLVKIAPLASKQPQTTMTSRPSQSLLAQSLLAPMSTSDEDSKAALKSLVRPAHTELDVEFKSPPSPTSLNSADGIDEEESNNNAEKHPLIVIPTNYVDSNSMILPDQSSIMDDSQRTTEISIEGESLNTTYQSPTTPEPSESDMVANADLGLRPRKACNCTKSQCLKLYCDCFANGEFCNRCNCNNCHNNLENEELRQKAIRGCLDRNPNAFRPKIGKAKVSGPEVVVRRHNKGCNCKRSGCLKNYCECYEAKIACSYMCKCVGCRNEVDTVERVRRQPPVPPVEPAHYRPPPRAQAKQPCSFMTSEVIEAVCQCLLAAAGEGGEGEEERHGDPLCDVIEEFARCLQDIIGAAHHAPAVLRDEEPA